MVNVITVEREYGSGAAGIAHELGKQLGWQVWDHEITEEIAKRLKCDIHAVEQREERLDPTYYRLFKTFMRGSYEDRIGTGVEVLDADCLARLFENIIKDVATRGNCIIIGRAAPWFLRERADTMHVFLYAPYEEKMRRILGAGRSREEAEDLLDRVDRDRAAFIKKYHDMNWPTRWLYHLMLNTKVGDENVIRMILEEMQLLNGTPGKQAAIAS